MTYRYRIPPGVLDCGGTAVLTDDGFFAAVTDFGNYAYQWRHTTGREFRSAFIGFSDTYILGKISHGKEYSPTATRAALRQQVLRLRRDRSLSARTARIAWDYDVSNVLGLYKLGEDCDIDVTDIYSTDYNTDEKAFVREMMPRLRAIIDDELKAERVP